VTSGNELTGGRARSVNVGSALVNTRRAPAPPAPSITDRLYDQKIITYLTVHLARVRATAGRGRLRWLLAGCVKRKSHREGRWVEEKGAPKQQRHYLHFKDVYINEGGGA